MRIFIGEVFVYPIPNDTLNSLINGLFDVRITKYLRLNTIMINMSWKCRFKNSFPLSVRTQIGRLCRCVEYLGFLKIDFNAHVAVVPVFDFRGTMCNNFENTSITVSKNL